jgi:hypothetical protein
LGGGVGGVCLVRVQVELEFGVGCVCGAFFGRLGVVACVLTYVARRRQRHGLKGLREGKGGGQKEERPRDDEEKV